MTITNNGLLTSPKPLFMHLGKYISKQQLRRLQYPARDALPVFDYIDALGEHPLSKRNMEYAGPPIPNEYELWPEVSERNRFLADVNIRRLCVTVEGGVGKTKLLEELEATSAFDRPHEIVLRFELRELPTDADHFLDSGGFLLPQRAETEMLEQRHHPQVQGLGVPDFATIKTMVRSAARAGTLTLIIDAFDQLDKQGAFDRANALRRFLSKRYYPKIRCIIAGRPYAIKRVWDALQLGELRSDEIPEKGEVIRNQQPVWTFCKLQKFSSDQVKEYLSAVSAEEGKDKLQALQRMDAEEIHLPRTLNIVRRLTVGELRGMQTASDLYWHAMNKTIDENFRRSRTEYQLQHLQVEHVRPIVSAVAFAMMLWKGEPVVEVPSVQSDKARDFFRFMKKAGFIDVLNAEKIDFQMTLLDLAQVDSESIQFHFYSESPTRDAPSEVRDIRMSDATVRDFFAAHWAARYLSQQLEWLKSQKAPVGSPAIDLESRLTNKVNSKDFKKFWGMLVGMPNQGAVSHEEAATEASWTAAVAPLFEVRKSRSTELMYRCWPDLLWRAGFMEYRDHVDRPNWNETPMAAGTLKAQREAKRMFEHGENCPAMGPARRLVVSFLSDYLVQCKAQEEACMSDPNVTTEMKSQFYLNCDFTPIDIKNIPLRSKQFEAQRKKWLAYLNEHYPLWLLERSFRVIEGGPFLYGEDPDPDNPSFVETFEISAYVLSEGMYVCFAPNSNKRSPSILRARDKLSWFDSLICSIWCHGRLPDEHEWEAAARGKVGILALAEHREFGIDGGEDDLPDYADFGRGDGEEPSNIGHRFPTTRAELYDVHGQVAEWCSNCDDFGLIFRMMRGGSFSSDAFHARCSFRLLGQPRRSDPDIGLRVSRARNPNPFLASSPQAVCRL